MPDNPNPDAPHEHLYWRHHRELARDTAALRPAPPAVVIHCVICRVGTTLDEAAGPSANDHTSR